ncbi:MAG TPA: N-acetylmuramoyl-L-alanine amidase [Candidatus Spyradenecus faecavium]|uniref:N-acetylmuramoyl-L-alanine amidase n=1 Tax=Candidatus Spyradenecus faecavium TaxID=2840947 RepID=A0A9D1NMZ1_9BACT|nr:N-acetylmuramoyl-L-alanine amidase [Candidatus Spyradenecus faecavium]
MKRLAVALLAILACGLCHALSYSNAYLSPRNKERARRDSTQYIILHTTEGEAKPSLRKLSKNGEAHYCVDRDGKVYRIVDRSRVAYHCGVSMWRGRRNLDDVSIGIEVVGYHDRALTSKQYAALRALVLELQQIYGVKDANVMPHAQVAYGTPNRWHPRSHRGRKRCGMGYATPAVRKLLGLSERWLSDPDVKAKRLVVGDAYLAQVLYAKNGDSLLPYRLPTAKAKAKPAPEAAGPRTYVIQKGQTAWDVARDAYNAAGTTYVFPSGARLTGDKIKNWEGIVAGTKVILGVADAEGSPVQTLAKGAHPRSLVGEAVFAADTWYVRPTGGCVQGSKLNAKTLAAMPPGTQILVGYARGGPVTSRRLPSQICPTQWDAPDTFYLIPGKTLQPSGDIDMRRVPPGTFVFYRN